MDKQESGLYKITNKINGNVYVGITDNFQRRWRHHRLNLVKGYKNKDNKDFIYNKTHCRHHQLYLQIEFNKLYNEYKERIWRDVYEFSIILSTSYNTYEKKYFEKIEDKYILSYREIQDGYYQKTNKENLELYHWVEKDNKIEIVNIIEDNKDDILKMYLEDNLSCVEIANKYSTGNGRIIKYLRRWGVEIKNFSEVILGFDINNEKQTIIDLYTNENMNATQIAEKYNTTCATISTYLGKWGVNLKSCSEMIIGYNITSFKDEIINLYINEFKSTIEIAKEYNTSKKTINKYLKKWGIKMRTSGETLSHSQIGDKRYNSIYVEVIDENGVSKIFRSMSECGKWMVDIGLTKTSTGGCKGINKSDKNKQPYKGYIFIKHNKSEYEVKKVI